MIFLNLGFIFEAVHFWNQLNRKTFYRKLIETFKELMLENRYNLFDGEINFSHKNCNIMSILEGFVAVGKVFLVLS